MKSICIIPARGNSKRIPRKNIKDFCGKPILSYSIETAIASQIFDEVMVSTDNSEIADLAIKSGAKIPFIRSSKNADDYATTEDVLREVLDNYRSQGKMFDICCCLYPTAPFVTGNILRSSFAKLKEYSCVIPIVEYSHPVQRGFRLSNECIEYLYPENAYKRSQDLQKVYHDSGQFYMFNVNDFDKNGSILSGNTYGLVLRESQVRDIDTEEDWLIAEVLYRCLNMD